MSTATDSRSNETSPTRQPRQSRIHSVGLPARTTLLPEPPPAGSGVPPSIPRRHSATPTVAPPPIPLRPPAIPKRSKNEKPIPVQKIAGRPDRSNVGDARTTTWSRADSGHEKLIDLEPAVLSVEQPASFASPFGQDSAERERESFLASFEDASFDETRGPEPKSNFDDLRKASRDLEKKLHERVARVADVKVKDAQGRRDEQRARQDGAPRNNRLQAAKFPKEAECEEAAKGKSREDVGASRRDAFREEETAKFAALSRCRREAEGRSKFEELQAASRNLERRLQERTEEDDQRRFHEMERRLKERPLSRYEELQRASQELERRLQPEARPGAEQRARYDADTERARNVLQQSLRRERGAIEKIEKIEKLPKSTQTNLPPPLSVVCQSPVPKAIGVRQDSNVSSDSFSQNSSPSYTSKTMDAPLLHHKHGKVPGRALASEPENSSGRPITKSTSTPASLQTIVRIHGSNNASLHHKIIRDMTSRRYVPSGLLRFRFVQLLVNVVALLAIAGGLAAYYKTSLESAARLENRAAYTSLITLADTPRPAIEEERNPAPGVCLPVIVSFCQLHKIPYNFTVFPNYMGNFGQRDAQHELELYDSIVDVKCYELAALFLCSVFVPKCGSRGHVVRPCRSLCFQTKRRCGFFLEVFGLMLPDYLECELFPENPNPDECVGHHEVIEAARRAERPVCTSGFQCDTTRCIPVDWRCDGHLDCADRTDEIGCGECGSTTPSATPLTLASPARKTAGPTVKDTLSKSSLHCGERRCMSASHICDGVMDCPWGQDERYCLKLSKRNGDVGAGRLEVYHAEMGKFMPACISHWNSSLGRNICSLLGYTTVDESTLSIKDGNLTLNELDFASQRRRLVTRKGANLLKEFQECILEQEAYPTVELTCSQYACGRRRSVYGNLRVQTRIVGGVEAAPGDWPFLAALLGGPEQIFYCAGVLIADQWVLTASHCIGNFSHTEVSGWTIQLGITRRQTHTYLGQKLKVKRVVPHPSYNLGAAHDNDVALFQLEKPVQYHEHLRPVCLPDTNMEIPPGTLCTVIGWGKKNDSESSEYESTVNEVQVPVLTRDMCNKWLAHNELNVTDGMICAGYPDGGKDACQGDSGGPLLCQDEADKERWYVGGLVSWGVKCAHPKLPGVYAYVPKYVPWIRKEMAKYSDDPLYDAR